MSQLGNKDANKLFEKANSHMQQGDIVGAVKLLKEAAELGHVYAATNLGICYYYGDGVIRDKNKAKSLFLSAAEKQDSSAMYYLGLIAKDEQDYSQAHSYFLRAAEMGNPYAQHDLGELYVSGKNVGIRQDFRKAIHWFAYAAEQGHPEAGQKFQMLYYNGHETKEEPTGFWFEREQTEGRTIPCSEPYKVTIRDSEYVVPGLRFK